METLIFVHLLGVTSASQMFRGGSCLMFNVCVNCKLTPHKYSDRGKSLQYAAEKNVSILIFWYFRIKLPGIV